MTDDPFPTIPGTSDWQSARNPSITAHPSSPEMRELWGGVDPSGLTVTDQSALGLSPFFSGAALISEAMGMMPLKVYKRLKSGGFEHQDQHPVNYCLTTTPNGWQTPSTIKSMIQLHMIMSGNSVSIIGRNGRGQGVDLNTILPINTLFHVNQDNTPGYGLRDFPMSLNDTTLQVRGNRNPNYKEYDHTEVFHPKAFGLNGYTGLSVLKMARQSLGLSQTVERFGQKFYDKGRPAGFLTKDTNLTETQRELLRKEFHELHETVQNAFNVGVLSGGLSWQGIGYTNEDAQFLQTRQFQVLEIARWLRIPPHMLGEISKATNANIETLMLDFITFTLIPWVTRWEEELNLKMFTPKEQAMGFCAAYDMDVFLRGDSLTRAKVEETDIRNGKRTVTEVRLASKLLPYPDGIGDKPLIMASQLDTFENVMNGTSKLHGTDPAPTKPAKD